MRVVEMLRFKHSFLVYKCLLIYPPCRMRKRQNVHKKSFVWEDMFSFVCSDLVVISLWPSHENNERSFWRIWTVSKLSAPSPHPFHSVKNSFSEFSITCRHFKQLHIDFRGICRFHCLFISRTSSTLLHLFHFLCQDFETLPFCTSTWKIALDNLVLGLF